MERITYRKTLDVHKSGVQFLLQGFETADNMSRVIEISLMQSGDAIDFPLERIVAMMYVTTPGASEPSINKCTIKDNKIVYEVLPIVVEGITKMQLKIIETTHEGASGVLASPTFAVEVTKSNVDDNSAEQSTTFTALEDAMAKAKAVYDERFLRMELTSDCIFRAYYADGTLYETDVLKQLFHNGNVLLSESFAHGGTGVRAGEDTDNSKYYSDVSRSESLKAKEIMSDSEDILEEVKLHGVYTAFSVDFEKGEVEYVSPSFKFVINTETGELEVIGQSYTFNDEVGRVMTEWLESNGVILSELQKISESYQNKIDEYDEDINNIKESLDDNSKDIEDLQKEKISIERGGTGAETVKDAQENLGITKVSTLSSYLTFVANENDDMVDAAFGKNNETEIVGVGKALYLYAKFKGETENIDFLKECETYEDLVRANKVNLIKTPSIYKLIKSSDYAKTVLMSIEVDLPDIVLYDKAITYYLDIGNATIYSYKSGTESYEHSVNTSGNLSITKTLGYDVTNSTKAFTYTIPFKNALPDLTGYRYLNIKMSDEETSILPEANSGVSAKLSVGGVDSEFVNAPKKTTVDITGQTYKIDLFNSYVNNPIDTSVILSLYFSGVNDGNSGKRATAEINIDKIWISET